jgi:hypothetical protein
MVNPEFTLIVFTAPLPSPVMMRAPSDVGVTLPGCIEVAGLRALPFWLMSGEAVSTPENAATEMPG